MEDQCIEKRSAAEKLLLFYGRASYALHCAISPALKTAPSNRPKRSRRCTCALAGSVNQQTRTWRRLDFTERVSQKESPRPGGAGAHTIELLEDPFATQFVDLGSADAQPFAEDLLIVLAQHR